MDLHTIEFCLLRDLTSGMTMSFEDVRVDDNWNFGYSPSGEVFELENAVRYSRSNKMNPYDIKFTATLHNDNEFDFKRFVNRYDVKLRLEISINGKTFYVYVNAGEQSTEVNTRIIKRYQFSLRCETRPLQLIDINSASTENGGSYDGARYNEGRYSNVLGSSFLNVTFNNDTDINSYFIVQGKVVTSNVTMYINDITLTINGLTANSDFYYSNIPGQLAINVNGVNSPQFFNPRNKSNFTFNLTSPVNRVKIEGLKESELVILRGFKIL